MARKVIGMAFTNLSKHWLLIVTLAAFSWGPGRAGTVCADSPHIALVDMKMDILPGTSEYLRKSIERAENEGARAIVVELDTPGGLLDSSQKMTQMIFASRVPVIVYVSPKGGAAISAGVFITLSGHVAAMAPGTSIGAAHPVSSTGANVESDMRAKVENITMAMVRSISEQRGRNVAWAEKAVKESSSLTENEALKSGVIDLVAEDLDDLLKRMKGKEVAVASGRVVLEDFSALPRYTYPMEVRDRAVNVLANPNIAALLWLGATAGISMELYHPGAIFPGVVGLICLILALAVSQIIPLSTGGLLLLISGAVLIGIELYVGSIILGIGGVIAIVLGALYLVDISEAPGLSVNKPALFTTAAMCAGFLLFVATRVARTLRSRPSTGSEGLVGLEGEALENFSGRGRVRVNGETWAVVVQEGIVQKGEKIRVRAVREGLLLEVEKFTQEQKD